LHTLNNFFSGNQEKEEVRIFFLNEKTYFGKEAYLQHEKRQFVNFGELIFAVQKFLNFEKIILVIKQFFCIFRRT